MRNLKENCFVTFVIYSPKKILLMAFIYVYNNIWFIIRYYVDTFTLIYDKWCQNTVWSNKLSTQQIKNENKIKNSFQTHRFLDARLTCLFVHFIILFLSFFFYFTSFIEVCCPSFKFQLLNHWFCLFLFFCFHSVLLKRKEKGHNFIRT